MLKSTAEIIFATDFSDASHSAIPAVARWVDATGARLTLLHCYNPAKTLYREAEARLHSFFAEADNYPVCQRMLISGDACEGIAQYCTNRPDALLMLPPSDQTGLPRPFHRSLRARLIDRLNIPIWTLGKTNVGDPMPAADRHIGAWLTSPDDDTSHIAQAAKYAKEVHGTLHLLYVVDEINEGSLTHTLTTNAPLGEEKALNWLRSIATDVQDLPKVDIMVRQGTTARCLRDMVHTAGLDMLMVSRSHAVRSGLTGLKINPVLSLCDAGIICFPKQSDLRHQLAQVPVAIAG